MSQKNQQTTNSEQADNQQKSESQSQHDALEDVAPKQSSQKDAGDAQSDSSKQESTSFMKNITSKNGLLSAISASLLVLVVPVLVYLAGAGVITLTAIGGTWVWVFAPIFLMAATRLFGKGTLEGVRKGLGK